MELALVSDILDRLKQCPAKQLETQSLEFKSWCKTEKDLSYEITEAAVCLSNTAGGLVIVGVDDKKTIPAAIEACPHPFLTVDSIKKWIWDLTKPPVNCNVVRLSDIFANLKGTPPGDLFIVEVRKTTHASGHRTNRGVSLIRIDTECRPEYFTERRTITLGSS
jgi:predicted HTH transcriptional regulator